MKTIDVAIDDKPNLNGDYFPTSNIMSTSAAMTVADICSDMKAMAKSISNVYIDVSFVKAIELILECNANEGKVVTTGMGKAGLAMQKFSAILRSFGIPSAYIHSGEASHGDLGLICSKDILFVASTSGKTREVLEIIELSKKINIWKVIGITSHPDSPVREVVDVVLDMGVIEEAGHLHLAPTSSIIVMMAITDALAVACAKKKNLTFDDYSKYHHSGYLGQIARNKANEE